MTTSLKDINAQLESDETYKKSKEIVDILKSMQSTPTAAEKTKLSTALSECSAFVLDPNFLGKNLGDSLDHLAQALENNRTIRYLRLRSCQLKSENTVRLIQALAKNKTVAYLDLGYNQMQPNVAADLIKNKALTYLDLSGNDPHRHPLGYSLPSRPVDVSQLTEALKTNTSLKILKLNELVMSGENATELVRVSLVHNSTLIELDLIADGYGSEPINLDDLIREIYSVPRPIRLPLLVPIDATPYGQDPRLYGKNQLVFQACLRHAERIQGAHAAGKALSDHLPNDISNIVAKYLGFETEYFTAGAHNQPAPVYSTPELMAHTIGTALGPHLNDDIVNIIAGYLGVEGEDVRSGTSNKPAPMNPTPILPELESNITIRCRRPRLEAVRFISRTIYLALMSTLLGGVGAWFILGALLPVSCSLAVLCLVIGSVFGLAGHLFFDSMLDNINEMISKNLKTKHLILIGASLGGVGVLTMLAALLTGPSLLPLIALCIIGSEFISVPVLLFSKVMKKINLEKQMIASNVAAVNDILQPPAPPATIQPVAAPVPHRPQPSSASNAVVDAANDDRNSSTRQAKI